MPDLNLNSLSRFSKKSTRLILEEYSHCEVPAGCGGVVLRWRRAGEPIPFTMRTLFASKLSAIFLDETVITRHVRPDVMFGTHVLGFHLDKIAPDDGVIMFRAEISQQFLDIITFAGDFPIRTQANGRWRYTFGTPANDDWKHPDFDDGKWQPLQLKEMNPMRPHGYSLSRFIDNLKDEGITPLGTQEDGSFERPIWIRYVFSITEAQP
ncbi:MAG: hypothetical protein L0154_25795 [Chloroflexi bacterium]|nr:hypothetical protein [Chloroflexota bacterium]